MIYHIRSRVLILIAFSITLVVIVTLQVGAQEATFVVNTRWSPNGERLATIDSENILHIWESTSGKQIKQFKITNEGLAEISWNPDGSQIAVATRKDFMVRIWEVETERLIQTLEGVPSYDEGMSVEWQPNGNLLAAVSFGEQEPLVMWENTGQGFQIIETESKASLAYDLRWSPNGQKLAFADVAGIHIIEDFIRLPLTTKRINENTTFWFVWSPDSSKIAGLSTNDYITFENFIQVVDVQMGEVLMTLPEEELFLGDLSWSLDSDQITTRGEDGVYHVWDVASKQIVDSFKLDQEIIPNYYTASPYGGRFAVTALASSRIGNGSPLEIVVLFESVERVQGIAQRCVADANNLTSAVTDVFNRTAIESLTETTLPAFVEAVEALPADAIPPACRADLLAVAEAVIDEP